MKKLRTLSLFLSIFVQNIHSQITITLGSEEINLNEFSASPYNGTIASQRIQFVYTAAELLNAGATAGSITSFAFKVTTLNTANLNNYEIRMGHTTASNAAAHNSAPTMVIKNAHTLVPGSLGWYTIIFDTPFEWNGVENILLDICYVRQSYTQGRIWVYNNTGDQLRSIRLITSSLICDQNVNTSQNTKPHAQFINTSSACQIPNGVAVSNILDTGATISWSAPPSTPGTGYEYEVRTSGTPGSGPIGLVASGSVTGLSTTVTGLSELTNYVVYIRSSCGNSVFSAYTIGIPFKTICSAPMAGNYTINKNAAASSTNFTSFASLISRLKDCGVSAPVVINVVSNSGPYTERVILPGIAGASSTKTITINGNGNTVQFNPSTTDRTIVRLEGAKHYVLDSLTIKSNNTSNIGNYIQLTQSSDSNVVRRCVFDFSFNSTSHSQYYGIVLFNGLDNVYTSGMSGNYNLIENNQIGGMGAHSTGIFIAGGPTEGNHFKFNKIIDWTSVGIESSGCVGCLFEGNEIYRQNLSAILPSNKVGLSFNSGPHHNTVVRNNKIWKIKGNLPGSNTDLYIGMSLVTGGTQASPLSVYNNVVELDGTSGAYVGISLSANHTYLYHNTIVIKGLNQTGTGQSSCLTFNGGGITRTYIKNNIFYFDRTGGSSQRLISINNGNFSSSSLYQIDNNVYEFHSPDRELDALAFVVGSVGPLKNLAAWHNWSGKDTNSIQNDPVFVDMSNQNFIPQSQIINNTGVDASALAPTDINGVIRGTSPDPGAYEFSPGNCVVPSNVLFSYIQSSSVVLNWSENGISTSWEVEYGIKGFTQGTGTLISNISTKPFTLTGLNELTEYDVYVRSNCGANNYTVWSRAFSFRTICSGALAGNYTINKNAASSATNFTSFETAIKKLIDCGVSGHVVFDVVAGSGPYNERLEIPELGGASSAATITFNGNGNTLEFNPNATFNYIVYLNGADHIIFDSLKIKSLNSQYGMGFLLNNQADSNVIRKCVFDFSSVTSYINSTGIAMSNSTSSSIFQGQVGSYNLFEKNTFIAANSTSIDRGITIYGNSSTAAIGNIIRGNKLENIVSRAIDIVFCVQCLIEDNEINNSAFSNSSNPYRAINSSNTSSGTIIRNNLINRLFGNISVSNTKAISGIYIQSGGGTSSNPLFIYNNILHLHGGSGTYTGIFIGGNHIRAYHNTIIITSPGNSGNSDAIEMTSNIGIVVQNNILFIDRDGTGYKVGIRFPFTNMGSSTFNHNVFYIKPVANANIGIGFFNNQFRNTLSDWQNATNQDANSVETNPVFVDVATFDYTPSAASINNIGTNLLSVVPNDFFKIARTSTPDPGAIEFSPSGCVIPSNLTASNIGSTSAQLGWTENGTSTVWEIEYGLQGFTPGTGTMVQNINANPYTLSGLTELTTYSFYVRSACSNNLFTPWAGPFDFSTTCGSPLIGTYTINQNLAASATNFTSFSDLAFRLNNCGVSGAVTVNVVAGTGPYIEKFHLNQISGTSATNTITINGNGNTLQYNTVANDRIVVYLNGTDRVTIDSLTIACTSNNYFVGVQFNNEADYNVFKRCTINFNTITTATQTHGIVFSSSTTLSNGTGNNGNYNLIEDNTLIANGPKITQGFSIYGQNNAPVKENIFRNNKILNTTSQGIIIAHCEDCSIEGNEFNREAIASGSSHSAITISGPMPGSIIRNNLMHNFLEVSPTSFSSMLGISVESGGTSAKPLLIYNNIVDINNGNAINTAIRVLAANVHVFHNTLNIRGSQSTSGSSYGLRTSSLTNVLFRNNIVYIDRSGNGLRYGVELASSSIGGFEASNNVYFINPSTATDFGVGFFANQKRETLSDWQSATAQDSNSVQNNPNYSDVPNKDFIPTAKAIDNIGVNLTAIVPTDFNGTSRSSTPDPGALEFSGLQCLNPSNLGASNITSASAQLTWTENGFSTQCQIEWGLVGFSLGTGTLINPVNSNVYTLSGLAAGFTYSYYVRSICGSNTFSAWVGPFTFTAPQIAVTIPSLHTFEQDAEGWITANQSNGWFRGQATAYEGSYGLYISNNGVNNQYDITQASVSHAYRDLNFNTNQECYIRFMWRGIGQNAIDRLRVWLVPTTYTPTAGMQITQLGSAPAGRIQLSGNLSNQSEFNVFLYEVPSVYQNETVRIVLEWINDATAGHQPPVAIDNFEINIFNRWTGDALNGDWNSPGNWFGNSIPTSQSSILFPTGRPSYPTITNYIEARDIISRANAPIQVQPTSGLHVKGLLRTEALISLNANSTGYAILIQNQVEGQGQIQRQMYLVEGLPNPAINDGGSNNGRWFSIGSPMEVNINQLQVTPALFPQGTIYQWNALTNDYELPAAQFDIGRGYVLYAGSNNSGLFTRSLPGNVTLTGNKTEGVNILANLNYSSQGVGFTGTIDGNELYGWNLIANPYFSVYDFGDFNNNPQDFGQNHVSTIHIRNSSNNGFQSFTPGSMIGNGRFIAPMQAFWVRTVTGGTFTFEKSRRVANQQPPLGKTTSERLAFKLEAKGIQNQAEDLAYFIFMTGASSGFDLAYDGEKLSNDYGNINLYSKAANRAVAVNAQEELLSTKSVPVYFECSQEGPYSLKLDQSENNYPRQVWLEDRLLNNFHPFHQEYHFQHLAHHDAQRFVLHFSPQSVDTYEFDKRRVSIQVWHSEGYAYIKNTLSELVNVELIDMTGRSLLKTTETTSEHETLKIKLPPLRAGIYLIKVSNGANYISVKFNHN
jgi:hypothetical protein